MGLDQRTVTTPSAHKAAADMLNTVQELNSTCTKLMSTGDTLSEKQNWDGPLAQQFRSSVWPDVHTALGKMVKDLTDLQGVLAKVNAGIARAGS